MTNRRDLFKAAGLAGAAALVSGQTLAAPKKGAARVLKGGGGIRRTFVGRSRNGAFQNLCHG